jgi:16S rRNA (uracil1498-N3)-methyltransferase
MTRRRWIADEFSATHAALTGEHAAHLIRVLRARVGQEFDISAGPVVRRGRIVSIADDRVEFELGAEISAPRGTKITLLLAVFKFDRMEWAIEKCTEFGVACIVPVIARRSEKYLAAASAKRVERWRKIALQAAEQSRRPTPPEIAAPLKLQEAISQATGLRIVLDESERGASLPDLLASDRDIEIVLAIGPEGGWTEDERESFDRAGWHNASLGATILRAETAAIAAMAIAVSQLGS